MDLMNNGYDGDFEDQGPVGLTLEEFEAHRATCEAIASHGESAKRLADNPDFKNLIMQGYFVDEPHSLADKIASGKFNEKSEASMFEQLRSIGHLRTFLSDIIEKGHLAEDELKGLEEAREAAILEEAGGEA